MSPFDDDPFDTIVREFFGGSPFRRSNFGNEIISSEEEERNIDFIENDSYAYLIFELPGYKEDDVSVSIRGNELIIKARANNESSSEDYVSQKLNRGLTISKTLPKRILTKGYKSTFKNGILEICFKKK